MPRQSHGEVGPTRGGGLLLVSVRGGAEVAEGGQRTSGTDGGKKNSSHLVTSAAKKTSGPVRVK